MNLLLQGPRSGHGADHQPQAPSLMQHRSAAATTAHSESSLHEGEVSHDQLAAVSTDHASLPHDRPSAISTARPSTSYHAQERHDYDYAAGYAAASDNYLSSMMPQPQRQPTGINTALPRQDARVTHHSDGSQEVPQTDEPPMSDFVPAHRIPSSSLPPHHPSPADSATSMPTGRNARASMPSASGSVHGSRRTSVRSHSSSHSASRTTPSHAESDDDVGGRFGPDGTGGPDDPGDDSGGHGRHGDP